MTKKYRYEEGMCKYMQYKGLWPVTYVSTDGSLYKKSCMSCKEVNTDKCQLGEDCEVFQIAAAEMENYWNLRDKTLN